MKSILIIIILSTLSYGENDILLKIMEWSLRNSNIVAINNDGTFQIYEDTRYIACKMGKLKKADFINLNKLLDSKEIKKYKFTSMKENIHCDGGVIFQINSNGKKYKHAYPCADSLKSEEQHLLNTLVKINALIKNTIKTEYDFCKDGYYIKLIKKDSGLVKCNDTTRNIDINNLSKIPRIKFENLKKAKDFYALYYLGQNYEIEQKILEQRLIDGDNCFITYLYKSKNSVLEYVKHSKNIPPNIACGLADEIKFSFSMNDLERENWGHLLKCKGVKMIHWFSNHVDIPYSSLERKIKSKWAIEDEENQVKYFHNFEGKTFNEIYSILINDIESSSNEEKKELEKKVKKEIIKSMNK